MKTIKHLILAINVSSNHFIEPFHDRPSMIASFHFDCPSIYAVGFHTFGVLNQIKMNSFRLSTGLCVCVGLVKVDFSHYLLFFCCFDFN